MRPLISLWWPRLWVCLALLALPVEGEMYTGVLEGEQLPAVLPWTPVNVDVRFRGDDVVAGFGRLPELRVYAPHAGRYQRIRWQADPDLVDGADRERYSAKRAAYLALRGDHPHTRFAFPALRELPRIPSTKPAFHGFLIDDGCNIWARHFPATALGIQDELPPVDPPPAETWTVLDSAGIWLGPIRLPEGFAAHDVANGRVYGVHTAAAGTETVRVYRIEGAARIPARGGGTRAVLLEGPAPRAGLPAIQGCRAAMNDED